jgi:hypothetical protein
LRLVEWLRSPKQTALRRAFVVQLKRVLLAARVPGADIPNVIDLQEMQAMLAERVKSWTEEWKQQGRQEGPQEGEANVLRRQLARRFGPLPTWAEQRLDQAGEAELESWADRILDALTLEDVFNRPS